MASELEKLLYFLLSVAHFSARPSARSGRFEAFLVLFSCRSAFFFIFLFISSSTPVARAMSSSNTVGLRDRIQRYSLRKTITVGQ